MCVYKCLQFIKNLKWNIVEIGVKHYKPKPRNLFLVVKLSHLTSHICLCCMLFFVKRRKFWRFVFSHKHFQFAIMNIHVAPSFSPIDFFFATHAELCKPSFLVTLHKLIINSTPVFNYFSFVRNVRSRELLQKETILFT